MMNKKTMCSGVTITAADIEKIMHEWDLMVTPYILFCNPKHEERLKKRGENKYLIIAKPYLDESDVFLVDRRKLEEIPGTYEAVQALRRKQDGNKL